jgi:hypothetical protein
MERYCGTGQSPQRAVAPTEEEDLLKFSLGKLVDVAWKRKSLTLEAVMQADNANTIASFAVSM